MAREEIIDSFASSMSVSEGMRVLPLLIVLASRLVAEVPISERSVGELEQRLEEIDAEVDQLASLSLRTGVGTVGYRSVTHEESQSEEWVEVDLGAVEMIDEIVLVPSIWRDTRSGFRADGFPLEFKVVVGTGSREEGKTVASFGVEDELLPRIAPLVIKCPRTPASWVRVEASVLSPRAWDGRHILQLSELLVFSGEENVALLKETKTSSPEIFQGAARDKEFLVNGFVPYLMDASGGEQSVAFVSEIGGDELPVLTIDLGADRSIDRIHLHAPDLSDTVPQAVVVDFGIPRHLVMEGALSPDFEDAVRLLEFQMESIYDIGPIIMRQVPEVVCRYVRVVALEPFMGGEGDGVGPQIAFAEIEIFSEGRNVALGREVAGNITLSSPERSFGALTDGRNLYGDILPLRGWMNELARRHDLGVERPVIAAELDLRYSRQKTLVNRLIWVVAFLVAGIVFVILIDRLIRMRQVSRIRERLAADLHDELGANLHTIGLLSDLAAEAGDSPEQLEILHRRIRSETERSGVAVRHCTDMLEAVGVSADFEEDMRRASRRIMSRLEHEIVIEGKEHLDSLKRRTRYDLFLFYKECLVNISRHAEASKFSTHLKVEGKRVRLVISDNGHGISDSVENGVPASLCRRARILGGKVSVDQPKHGGTRVTLTLG